MFVMGALSSWPVSDRQPHAWTPASLCWAEWALAQRWARRFVTSCWLNVSVVVEWVHEVWRVALLLITHGLFSISEVNGLYFLSTSFPFSSAVSNVSSNCTFEVAADSQSVFALPQNSTLGAFSPIGSLRSASCVAHVQWFCFYTVSIMFFF